MSDKESKPVFPENCSEIMQVFHKFRRLNITDILPDITQMEFHTLAAVMKIGKEQGNEDVSVSAVGREINASMAMVSKRLRTLEEKELIVRVTDPKDRRNTYIHFTCKGKKKIEETQKIIEDFMETILDQVGREEVEQLKESLHKMYEAAKREIELRKKEQKEESRNGKDI
jgi:DNA-binding MarR family transcriptional regulator